jgi:hypothetical protein
MQALKKLRGFSKILQMAPACHEELPSPVQADRQEQRRLKQRSHPNQDRVKPTE